jgi:threonine/homoserine/homoserine lactone efflux protein
MTLEALIAASMFAFVTSITPGPNNAMLLASGVNHGFVRTIPHLLGINLGFPAMLLAIGLGLSEIFAAFPVLHQILQIVGTTYLLYLAWMLASAGPLDDGSAVVRRPMTFLQAAAFQWVNPKAWIIATGAIATFASGAASFASIAVLAAIYAVVNLPCIAAWAGFGVALREVLTSERRVRVFNIAMALLLILSLYPTLSEIDSVWRG